MSGMILLGRFRVFWWFHSTWIHGIGFHSIWSHWFGHESSSASGGQLTLISTFQFLGERRRHSSEVRFPPRSSEVPFWTSAPCRLSCKQIIFILPGLSGRSINQWKKKNACHIMADKSINQRRKNACHILTREASILALGCKCHS